jgi:hypothetical protein
LYEVTAKMLNYYRKREWDSVMAIIEVGRSAADHSPKWVSGIILRTCSRIPGKPTAGRLEWRFCHTNQVANMGGAGWTNERSPALAFWKVVCGWGRHVDFDADPLLGRARQHSMSGP